MLDLTVLKEEDRKERKRVIMSLKGKLKGEIMETNHQFPCIKITSSGLNVDLQAKLLIAGHRDLERTGRPAITDWGGNMLNAGNLD